MDRKINVLQHGVGAKGKIMVKLILNKTGLNIVGAVDIVNVGKDLGEVVGHGGETGVSISDNLDATLAQCKPDVMLDATFSYLKQLYPIFKKVLEAGVNIISIAPQAFNPWVSEPELSKKLDETAKRNAVSLVGAGMSPGFHSDVLPVFFSGICGNINKIICERVSDVTKSGPTFRRRCGFGLFKDEAESKLAVGEVQLMLAYPDDVHFIADGLGWTLSDVHEEKEFLISEHVRDHLPDYKIEPGQVYGFRHDCYGVKDGKDVIGIRSVIATDPALDGFEVHYKLSVEGEPSFTINSPDLISGNNIPIAVAANAVNWIPYVMKAKPGLLTSAKDFSLVTYLP
ncbi:MAG: hypothetical protein ACOC7P_00520 [Chloroflexota bacterium]